MLKAHSRLFEHLALVTDLVLIAICWVGAYAVRFYVFGRGDVPPFSDYTLQLLPILLVWGVASFLAVRSGVQEANARLEPEDAGVGLGRPLGPRMEQHLAGLARPADRLPLDVVERVPPLGREVPVEGQSLSDDLHVPLFRRHLRPFPLPVYLTDVEPAVDICG